MVPREPGRAAVGRRAAHRRRLLRGGRRRPAGAARPPVPCGPRSTASSTGRGRRDDERQRAAARRRRRPRRHRTGHGDAGRRRRSAHRSRAHRRRPSTPSATAARTPTSRSREGEVDVEERTVECWRHGSQFSLETGEPLSLPATKPTPTYEVVVRRRPDPARSRPVSESAAAHELVIDGLRAGVGGREILRGIDLTCAAARSTPSWARTARASRRCRTCWRASPATRCSAAASPSTASTSSPSSHGSGHRPACSSPCSTPSRCPACALRDLLREVASSPPDAASTASTSW